ncbi:tetratricopeptide repeat protein [Clostridium grantii]|uniref:Pentatricopeptide repeat domain-containing protein (PPR motif) n=1 Tax=Clostridium grantii DSM 8605 TaxID=1121316 RepID=A0A1M5VVS3_9CLOT|nr:tetratricopeptide repeat protein [Clostridium grantii]SHH79311.1 pentatricopeptide repeat domain-containing protein (PPR motif) [Clostridium grantii DSM 8605]
MLKIHSIYLKIKGNRAYGRGDVDACLNYYKKACKYKKKGAKETKLLYGNLLLKQGRVEEAHEVFNELLGSKLNEKEELLLKGNISLIEYKKGNLTKAIEILEELDNKNIKATYIYQNLGCFYLLNKDYEKALKFNLEAFSYDSTDKVILDNLGQTYLLQKNYDKATEIYEDLLEQIPNFPEPYYNFALVKLAFNEKKEAIDLLNKALNTKITFLCTLTKKQIEEKIEEIETSNTEQLTN